MAALACNRMLTLPCLFSGPPLMSKWQASRAKVSSSGSSSSRMAICPNSLLCAIMDSSCNVTSQAIHPQHVGQQVCFVHMLRSNGSIDTECASMTTHFAHCFGRKGLVLHTGNKQVFRNVPCCSLGFAVGMQECCHTSASLMWRFSRSL